MASVAIIMGSISDYETMKGAEKILKEFNVDYRNRCSFCPQDSDKMYEFAKGQEKEE
ncbi:AIR carboxylase family protein [Caloramator sp. mosi_1]|uniref:AIR carboxylase family protein n=1 Tax=Caloramator sp. mosi_1 TaxID=3023090 RepID=UPI002361FC9A|nr:AIR carboxylase family protein [Caloramator sp. mosi_1]WDC84510.1 AIR carboxylase family protein [Caloramator sp. mosi_1]